MDSRDNDMQTPLHVASEAGHVEVVKFLIDQQAHVDAITKTDSYTPLFLATRAGNVEVVKELVARGADMRLADKRKLTPLEIAREIALLKILVGGDPEYFNQVVGSDMSPIRFAANSHTKEFFLSVALFQANATYHGDFSKEFDKAVEFWELIAYEGQGSCLHVVARLGDLLSCRVLVNLGADIDLENSVGQTPLDIAIYHGHSKLVDYFFELDTELTKKSTSQAKCAPQRLKQQVSVDLGSANKKLGKTTQINDSQSTAFQKIGAPSNFAFACVLAWKFVEEVQNIFAKVRSRGIVSPAKFDTFVQLMDLDDLVVSVSNLS